MKNIHILPTDKPSRLVLDDTTQQLILINKGEALWGNRNIYITNDSEIKEGDWFYLYDADIIAKYVNVKPVKEGKKIIITTDQDLIKDGIQAIDDEFLEWFVKNPSCEEVEVKKGKLKFNDDGEEYGFPDMSLYKIIIPKEELTISDEAKQRAKNYMSLKGALEPKQETLEEANWKVLGTKKDTFYNGAKWQAERMYSEEGVLKILRQFNKDKPKLIFGVEEWFEQFKNK